MMVVRRLLQLLYVVDQVCFPTSYEFLLFMFLDIHIDHYPLYPHEKNGGIDKGKQKAHISYVLNAL
jgi:hypothetical protein